MSEQTFRQADNPSRLSWMDSHSRMWYLESYHGDVAEVRDADLDSQLATFSGIDSLPSQHHDWLVVA